MRVLYFSYGFGSPTTTFIRNETEFFSESFPILYLCTELSTFYPTPKYVKLIPFLKSSFYRKVMDFLWRYDFACNFKNKNFSKKINEIINTFKPDIIHCHFGFEALSLLDNLNNLNNHKIIVHFNGYDASMMMRKKTYVKRLQYYLSKKNIYTISCNQYFLDEFKNKYSIKVAHEFNLKYGVNVDSTFIPSRVNNKNEFPVFIQVSSLSEKKGHEYTLRAFKKFIETTNKAAKLYLVGNGYQETFLRNLVIELGIINNVHFMGTKTPAQVSELYKEVDVFLHHSITDKYGDMEGIPVSIMEAMSMELPIVSTYHSGIPELVINGVNGFLVKEKDTEEYALKMADALKMGRLSINRERIINEFNLKNHNDKLKIIYQKIVSS